MTDIVERLRTMYSTVDSSGDAHAGLEAADVIERLRDEVAEWRQAAKVEAGLRREFLARAEKAEASLSGD